MTTHRNGTGGSHNGNGNGHGKGIPLVDWTALRDASVADRVQAAKPPLRPLTKTHKLYQAAIQNHTIVFASGPAGTGKTTLACEVAARLLKAGQVRQIVLTRPLVTCDEELGILPGTAGEKMAPYLVPLEKALRPHFGDAEYDRLVATEVIAVVPLATMRGMTLTAAAVVADEMQNATRRQLRMLLTRLGDGTRMVVAGDVTQDDRRPGDPNPLAWTVARLRGNQQIKVVRFTHRDCLRPPLVRWIDKRLSDE